MGLKGIVLSDVTLSSNPRLVLQHVTIGYSLPELVSGHLHDLTLSGLTLEVQQTPNKWNVSGLDGWHSNTPSTPFAIPMSADQLTKYPQNAKLEDSMLHVLGNQWKLDLPLRVTWQQLPITQLDYNASTLKLTAGEVQAETSNASFHMTLSNAKKWEGTWHIADIAIKTAAASDMPVLQGNGTLIVDANHAVLEGKFNSADTSYNAAFHIDYALSASAKSQAIVSVISLPWNGGRLSAHNVRLPMAANETLNATLEVEHVSIAELMQSLTGKRATGTGVVSGKLPITLNKDGSITLHDGALQADEPGTIALSPDAIPGDNQQVVLVRQVLEDLHYNVLSIAVDNGADKKLSVMMTLQGNNPKVYKDKPVKLNVHLTGDILDVVRQSMLTSNPTKLLQQGEHDKK